MNVGGGESRFRRVVRSRAFWILTPLLLCGWAAWTWLGRPEQVAALVRDHGTLAAIVLVPLQTLVSATPFPGEIVALANGALLGFWWGTIAIWGAWMGTAYLQYYLMRAATGEFDLQHARERLPQWLRGFPVHHPVFLICGRWVPYGAHIVNGSAGAFRVGLWRFTWCAAIGVGVGAVTMAAIANGWALLSQS